jgi:hypothetical protein
MDNPIACKCPVEGLLVVRCPLVPTNNGRPIDSPDNPVALPETNTSAVFMVGLDTTIPIHRLLYTLLLRDSTQPAVVSDGTTKSPIATVAKQGKISATFSATGLLEEEPPVFTQSNWPLKGLNLNGIIIALII